MDGVRHVCSVLAIAVAVALLPATATADDHRPPRTVLRSRATAVQDGYLHEYCWVKEVQDGVALTECRDKIWVFGRAYVSEPGSRFRIRIHKATQPNDFSIQAWPERGDEISGPEGQPEQIPFTLTPKLRDTETVAWDAIFTLEGLDRHYFIRADGMWPDEQGDGGNQDANWLFHVRTT